MAQGLCTQRHFPAVAQPFRVLWAPWPAAALSAAVVFLLSVFLMLTPFSSLGSILLVVGLPVGHGIAIAVGIKARYLADIVGGIENRKTGSTNLKVYKEDKTSFDFANI